MKRLARFIVVAILGWQVRRLRSKHSFKVVGVVGSIGKTSTKRAIAEVLGSKVRVQYQSGNYNDLASVPLVFFGQNLPPLFNPVAWLGVFFKNEQQISRDYPYDVVVVEIGTDGPGQIAAFARYIELDIALVTAITPEHMEHFGDLDAVAKEELAVKEYANRMVVNVDLVDQKYVSWLQGPDTYAIRKAADFRGKLGIFKNGNSAVTITRDNAVLVQESFPIFSDAQLYSYTAAATIWALLDLPLEDLTTALHAVSPVPGRMQLLAGKNQSIIIDDSYNASPDAVVSALHAVYKLPAPYKVALLGNMNELGKHSASAHTFAGEQCDPRELDEVITLGPDANQYLADAAKAQGCKVTSFESPYAAGVYIASILKKNSLVLVKGSQNKVFAEESIKSLLAEPLDARKLVRQSDYWMRLKRSQFSDAS